MSVIPALRPWEYEVSGGFKMRGYFTPPTGKPVLHFIHGNGFCGLSYEPFLALLLEDVDLFLTDAQGHGNSDNALPFRGWDNTVRYVHEVWTHFSQMYGGVTKIASGHSFGSVVTTVLLGKTSGLFDGALFLDPTYVNQRTHRLIRLFQNFGLLRRSELAKQAKVRGTHWANYEDAWQYFHKRGVFEDWDDAALKAYVDHALKHHEDGSVKLKCHPEIESAIFGCYTRDLWRAIKSVSCPTRIVIGDNTYPFVPKACEEVIKVNRLFQYQTVKGGHCFMQERPEAIARIVRPLIKDLIDQHEATQPS